MNTVETSNKIFIDFIINKIISFEGRRGKGIVRNYLILDVISDAGGQFSISFNAYCFSNKQKEIFEFYDDEIDFLLKNKKFVSKSGWSIKIID